MDERDERLLADDAAFERLFSSLDDVRASDELKSATLAAIFAQMDGEEAEEAADSADATVAAAPAGHRLTLVEGGAGHSSSHAREVEPAAAEPAATGHGLHLADDVSRSPKRARVPRLRLRVAAALVVVAVGLGGGVAYATPVTHVTATTGTTTYDLGVNLFGITVSAEADSDDGGQVLERLQLRHTRLEDALDQLLDACEDADDGAGSPQVSVEGRGPFGGASAIAEKAERIAKAHEHGESVAADNKSSVDQGTPQDGAETTQPTGGAAEQTPSETLPAAPSQGGDKSREAEAASTPEETAGKGPQPSGEADKPDAAASPASSSQGEGPVGAPAGPKG